MSAARRARVVAGNWKMHNGPGATRSFFSALGVLPDGRAEVLIFPPSLSLPAAMSSPDRDPRVGLGIQNIHFEDAGAYTGEVSAPMAAEAGATHALVGHSERRHVFGESDHDVGRKAAAAMRAGLVPVICVGETLEERRAGRLEAVILGQLDTALSGLREGLDATPRPDILLAYEPVWAIGTGETATPQDAAEAHRALRGHLAIRIGKEAALGVPILYGGSAKPANAEGLLAADHVDGLLVGGASLDPDSFRSLVAAAG